MRFSAPFWPGGAHRKRKRLAIPNRKAFFHKTGKGGRSVPFCLHACYLPSMTSVRHCPSGVRTDSSTVRALRVTFSTRQVCTLSVA